MARAFQPDRYANDLRFILFGGEEQGLFGSRRYVQSLSAAERARLLAVVNLDMVGSSNTAARTVLLEGAAVSQRVIDALSEAASTYTQLEIETSLHPFNSDHVPFIDAGIPAVLTIEGADQTNDRVHSARDTADRLDYDLLMEIVRMNIAFVSQALGRVG
jgi:Zn-dependent M28 family amino/carboxypeptidase